MRLLFNLRPVSGDRVYVAGELYIVRTLQFKQQRLFFLQSP